jgi:hypothetical protein
MRKDQRMTKSERTLVGAFLLVVVALALTEIGAVLHDFLFSH